MQTQQNQKNSNTLEGMAEQPCLAVTGKVFHPLFSQLPEEARRAELIRGLSIPVAEFCRSTPGLASLYSENGVRADCAQLTYATAEALSGLITPDTCDLPFWVFRVPEMSDQDARDLRDTLPQAILNDDGTVALAWDSERFSIRAPYSFEDSRALDEEKQSEHKLFVAFVNDSLLAIKLISINSEQKSVAKQIEAAAREAREARMDNLEADFFDEIDFIVLPAKREIDGKTIWDVKTREFYIKSLRVPSREVWAMAMDDFLSAAPVLAPRLKSPPFQTNESVACIQALGQHLGPLLPPACASLPVLIIKVPNSAYDSDEMLRLVSAPPLPLWDELTIDDGVHIFIVPTTEIRETMNRIFEENELIIVFVGDDREVKVRCWEMPDDLMEDLSLSEFVANNRKDIDTMEILQDSREVSSDIDDVLAQHRYVLRPELVFTVD